MAPDTRQSGPSCPDTQTNPARIGCAPTFQIGCDQGVCRPWPLHRGFRPWRRAKGLRALVQSVANRPPFGCRHRFSRWITANVSSLDLDQGASLDAPLSVKDLMCKTFHTAYCHLRKFWPLCPKWLLRFLP